MLNPAYRLCSSKATHGATLCLHFNPPLLYLQNIKAAGAVFHWFWATSFLYLHGPWVTETSACIFQIPEKQQNGLWFAWRMEVHRIFPRITTRHAKHFLNMMHHACLDLKILMESVLKSCKSLKKKKKKEISIMPPKPPSVETTRVQPHIA